MSDHAGIPGRGGRFMKAAERIADLDHPFYDEERQRDVWNEASAVGFQLMLWLGLAAAGAMVWIGGLGGVPYAMAVLLVITAGGVAAHEYASRLGVSAAETDFWSTGRTLVHGALVAVLGSGMVWAWWTARGADRSAIASFGVGFTAGAGAALVVVAAVFAVVAARRARVGERSGEG